MAEKRRPTGLAAYMETAAPTALSPPAPARQRRAAPAARRPAAPDPRPPRTRSAPAQGERVNLTYRATPGNWERLKHLALADRASIQELIHTSLSREFQRRGLPPLTD
jgi:hypothetical protein